MSKKNLLSFLLCIGFLQVFFSARTNAQTANPHDFSERFAVRSVRLIASAEATFQAISNGVYGSLAELRDAGLIDEILANGEKYGYVFMISKTNPTATSIAKFQLTATPRNYPKSGRRSFYIDQTGEMHADNKNGATANDRDPIIDDCASFGLPANERCTMLDLRTLASAEKTFQSISADDNYGLFSELFKAGLINSRMATGTNHGYHFTVEIVDRSPNVPAFFRLRATPTNYGVNGIRSFYIDTDGILRGADKQGQPADENDPPVDN